MTTAMNSAGLSFAVVIDIVRTYVLHNIDMAAADGVRPPDWATYLAELLSSEVYGGNARGGSDTRRHRREWLVETFRADRDALGAFSAGDAPLGRGVPACRCYRCGRLLTVEIVTVDRIVPGCKGGTYRRGNIRPACASCNSETGGGLRRSA
jgi:hypothetical protein